MLKEGAKIYQKPTVGGGGDLLKAYLELIFQDQRV